MQLSQTVSSTIAQIKVSNSQITNQTKKDLAPVPSSFFQFLYNLKINLLWIVLMGEGFLALFRLLLLLLLKKDFEGLIHVFPL